MSGADVADNAGLRLSALHYGYYVEKNVFYAIDSGAYSSSSFLPCNLSFSGLLEADGG